MDKAQRKAYAKVYLHNNREKVNAYKKVWADANKDKIKAYGKKYYQTHKDKIRVCTKAYRKAHPKKIKLCQKAYREANKEKIKILNKADYELNKEKHKIWEKAWRENNPEKNRESSRKQRALKRKAPYEPINEKIVFMRDGWICQICKKRVDKRFKGLHPMARSLDHIIPLSRGGSHIYKNVQLAHLGCNSSKHNNVLPQGQQLRIF